MNSVKLSLVYKTRFMALAFEIPRFNFSKTCSKNMDGVVLILQTDELFLHLFPWRSTAFHRSKVETLRRETAMNIRIDHCVIHVREWERSNAFYRDVLGAELIPRGAGWAYRFGETQLNCHGPGVNATPVARQPVQPGNSDLCFVWPGPIENAITHLQQHGVEVELGPVKRNGAQGEGVSIYFRDPDGSLLEFITYVA